MGLAFPTKGSSTLSDTFTSLNSCKYPCFLLCAALFLSSHNSLSLSLSLSLYCPFFPKFSTPFSYTVLLFIAWGLWGFHDYILISLVWVGSDVIIPDIEFISLEMEVVALELISASKRLSNSNTPKGNTKQQGRYSSPSIRSPEQTMISRIWAYRPHTQCGYGLTMWSGPNSDSWECLGQGHTPYNSWDPFGSRPYLAQPKFEFFFF